MLLTGAPSFSDEMGELQLDVQSKLLRASSERTITPLGSYKEIAVDVRVIAATHCDLKSMVSAGHFREDLYYRLNVIELKTMPLRDRPEDIEDLASHIVGQLRAAQRNATQTPLPPLPGVPAGARLARQRARVGQLFGAGIRADGGRGGLYRRTARVAPRPERLVAGGARATLVLRAVREFS